MKKVITNIRPVENTNAVTYEINGTRGCTFVPGGIWGHELYIWLMKSLDADVVVDNRDRMNRRSTLPAPRYEVTLYTADANRVRGIARPANWIAIVKDGEVVNEGQFMGISSVGTMWACWRGARVNTGTLSEELAYDNRREQAWADYRTHAV